MQQHLLPLLLLLPPQLQLLGLAQMHLQHQQLQQREGGGGGAASGLEGQLAAGAGKPTPTKRHKPAAAAAGTEPATGVAASPAAENPTTPAAASPAVASPRVRPQTSAAAGVAASVALELANNDDVDSDEEGLTPAAKHCCMAAAGSSRYSGPEVADQDMRDVVSP